MSSQTTATRLVSNLEDMFLECSICLDKLHCPRTLPCLHVFCDNCISQVLSAKVVNGQFQCPQCRQYHGVPHDGSAGFRISFYHENLSGELDKIRNDTCLCSFCDEGAKGSYACIKCCEILCGECERVHKKHKKTKDHVVQAITESNREEIGLQIKHKQSKLKKCRTHSDEDAKLYCDQVQKEICYLCVFSQEHSNHNVKCHRTIDEKCKEFAYEMETLNDQLVKLLKTTEDTLLGIKNLKLMVDSEAVIFKKQIEDRRDELVKIIYEIAKEMVHTAEVQHQKDTDTITDEESKLMIVHSNCRDSIQKIRDNDIKCTPLSDIVSVMKDAHGNMQNFQPKVNISEIQRRCYQPLLVVPIKTKTKKIFQNEFGSVNMVTLTTQKPSVSQLRNVFVMCNGRTLSFHDISSDLKVDEFQEMLVLRVDPLNGIRISLHYGGKTLKTSTALQDYGITNNSTLHATCYNHTIASDEMQVME